MVSENVAFSRRAFLEVSALAIPILSSIARPTNARAQELPSRIHVLALPRCDAIVLESQGRFAVVDSAGGPATDAAKGLGSYALNQDKVLSYMRQLGMKSGNVDFYLGTHPHHDHIGSSYAVINEFKPQRVYMSYYDNEYHAPGNQQPMNTGVYLRMMNAAKDLNIPIIQDLDPSAPVIPSAPGYQFEGRVYDKSDYPYTTAAQASLVTDKNHTFATDKPECSTGNPEFDFGDFHIEIVNYGDYYRFVRSPNPNDWCWGLLLTHKSGGRAFLAGDINNSYGTEDWIAGNVGAVDFLKMGHHGHGGSNTHNYLASFTPSLMVNTGYPSYLPNAVRDDILKQRYPYLAISDLEAKGAASLIVSFDANGKVSYSTTLRTQLAPSSSSTPNTEQSSSKPSSKDTYRVYNPNSGEHFYTLDATERDYLSRIGWRYEGVGWKAPAKSNTPVYRLYNPNAGEHFYTCDKSERDFLSKIGWHYEGIGWYSADSSSHPVYRLYNPNAVCGTHHYTTSAAERDFLTRIGWRSEGKGWNGA